MSKRGATIMAISVVAVIGLFVFMGLIFSWDSPLKIVFMPKKFKFDKKLMKANAFLGADDCYRAKPLFEDLLKTKPEEPALHFKLGICHARQGEPELAKKEFEKTIKLDPDGETAAVAHASIASVIIKQGEDLLESKEPLAADKRFNLAKERLKKAKSVIKGK